MNVLSVRAARGTMTCLAVCAAGIQAAFASDLCLVPSQSGGNWSFDCQGGLYNNNDWIGYTTGVGPPCSAGSLPAGCHNYGWTISASSTDPYVNAGPLSLPAALYLWYVCDNTGSDLLGTDFGIAGSIPVSFVIATPGWAVGGTPASLSVNYVGPGGCATPPLLAAIFSIPAAVSVDEPDVDEQSWGGTKSEFR